MTKRSLSLFCCFLFGCARAGDVTSAAPWTAGPSEPASWAAESSGAPCHGDVDCPVSELCKPGQNRCVSAYPDPRLLDQPPSEKEDCWLANVYFSDNSTELVGDAERWLDYNLRCLRARQAQGLILKGHAERRGDSTASQKLAIERGKAVKQLLLWAGCAIPIQVRSPGFPKVPLTQSEKDYEYDRRVEFWAR